VVFFFFFPPGNPVFGNAWYQLCSMPALSETGAQITRCGSRTRVNLIDLTKFPWAPT